MFMTIQSSVKDTILATSASRPKVEIHESRNVRDLDQQMEKRADDDAAESDRTFHGRKCRSPILWAEIGESSLIGPELVQETTDKVVLIKEKHKAARDRQKSCADNRRKPLEFEVGERVMLKVSPWKGVITRLEQGEVARDKKPPCQTIMELHSKWTFNHSLMVNECSQLKTEIHLSQVSPTSYFQQPESDNTAKKIWDNVEMLMQGSGRTLQQRKEDLFDEFERFRAIGNEPIHDYFEAKEKELLLIAEAEPFSRHMEWTLPKINSGNGYNKHLQVYMRIAMIQTWMKGPNAAAAFMANLSSTSGNNHHVNEDYTMGELSHIHKCPYLFDLQNFGRNVGFLVLCVASG
ncbi:hypothetical protein Tco_0562533 [Tanacetum coccineum]